jgi:hypothetical protein
LIWDYRMQCITCHIRNTILECSCFSFLKVGVFLFYSPTYWFLFMEKDDLIFYRHYFLSCWVCWIKYEIENYILFCLLVVIVIDQLLFLEFFSIKLPQRYCHIEVNRKWVKTPFGPWKKYWKVFFSTPTIILSPLHFEPTDNFTLI